MPEVHAVTYRDTSDLLRSPHPFQPPPAGLWYCACSLPVITPQLKCADVSARKALRRCWLRSWHCLPHLSPQFYFKNGNYSWSRSHLADVSQLEAMKTIVLCKFALCTDGKDHTP